MKGGCLTASAVWFVCFASLVVLLSLPTGSVAIEYKIQSDTIFRSFARDTISGSDQSILPGYEYLQIDMGNLTEKGLSFHLYGWGRYDFTDNDFYNDNTAGELLYGYLEYNKSTNNMNARFGRQYVFEGVANEAVDGFRLSGDLGRYLAATVYAGQPVGLDSTDGRGSDSIYGGRIALHKGMQGEVGLSYKNIENNGVTTEEMAGVDISAYLPWGVNFYGNSVRNMETKGWAEHAYGLNFSLGDLHVRPHYSMFDYKDYLGTGVNSSNPFNFLATTGEGVGITGLDLTWLQSTTWVFGGKLKSYNYDIGDTNYYYSALATWHGIEMNEVGCEIGVQDGSMDEQSYRLMRLYWVWDSLGILNWLDIVTGEITYSKYDKDIFGQDYSFFSSLGIGNNLMNDALNIKLSADFSDDPFFDNDLRSTLSLTYNFDHGL